MIDESSKEKPNLKTNSSDIAAAVSRGALAACPVVGGLIAEVVDQLIPNQKLDRVIDYMQIVESNVADLGANLGKIKTHLQTEYGCDLLEEGLVQASRAITKERRERLANLTVRSLSAEELKFAETRKLLNLLQELTDPELLWLVYFASEPTLGSEYHKQFIERHPDVMRPASRATGAPQEEIDRGALQDSYKNTLLRFDLLKQHGGTLAPTSLGRLLLRYIENPDQ